MQQYVFVAVVHCTCHMLGLMKKEKGGSASLLSRDDRASPTSLELSPTSHAFIDSHLFAVSGFFFFVAKERLAHASMVDSMPRSRIAGAHMMSCDSSCEEVSFFSLSLSAKGV